MAAGVKSGFTPQVGEIAAWGGLEANAALVKKGIRSVATPPFPV